MSISPRLTFGDSGGTGAPRLDVVGMSVAPDEMKALEQQIRLRYTDLAKLEDGHPVCLETKMGMREFSILVRNGNTRCPELSLIPTNESTADSQFDFTALVSEISASLFPQEKLLGLPQSDRTGLLFIIRELVQFASDSPRECLLLLLAEHVHLCRRVAEVKDPDRESLYRLAARGLIASFSEVIVVEDHDQADSVERLRAWAVSCLAQSWAKPTD